MSITDPSAGADDVVSSADGDAERQQLWDEFEDAETDDDTDPDGDEGDADETDEDDDPDLSDQGTEGDADTGQQAEPNEDPADLKSQVERLQHQLRSSEGRSKSLQRKVDELTTRIRETSEDVADGKRAIKATRDHKPKIDKAKEDYADAVGPLADVIDPILARQEKELQRTEARLARDQRELQDLMRQEQDLFLKEHPDGFSSIRPHQDAFERWVADQPLEIRNAFAANRKGITDHVAAALVVSRWKQELAGNGSSTTEPNKLDQRRQRQLRGGKTTRDPASTNVTQEGPAGDSRAAYWAEFERLDAKKSRQSSQW